MTWSGRGGSRKWRRLRKLVLERDDYRCQLKYADRCRGRADTVHHTQPWDGDPADAPAATLIAACFPCNHHAGQPANPDPEPKPWNP